MKNYLLLTLSMLISLSSIGKSINIGLRDSLFSKVLKENRPLSIYLPPSYFANEQQKFPVLYILDGDYNFQYVTGLIELQSSISEDIPEMIVVGISGKGSTTYKKNCKPNVENSEAGGNADNVAIFIKEELIPYIDSQYKAADYKILSGHSVGGLFIVNTALKHPELFDNYIAISPALWWENNTINSIAEKILRSTPDYKSSVYVSLADEKGMGVRAFLSVATSDLLARDGTVYSICILSLLFSIYFFSKLNKNSASRVRKIVYPSVLLLFGISLSLYLLFLYYPSNTSFKFKKFAEENHNSVGVPTYIWALQDIFQTWKVESQYFESAEELNQHHKKSMATYGSSFNMPKGTLANTALYILKYNKAGLNKMQEKIADYYPYSLAYFNTLLVANYLENKELENAEKLLLETLKRQPESFEAYQKLSELKTKQNKPAAADSLIIRAIEIAKNQKVRQWQLNELIEVKELMIEEKR